MLYLKNRHELLKKEMLKRGFRTDKTIDLKIYPRKLCKSWKPNTIDKRIIIKRLKEKIELKPSFYKYYGSKNLRGS